MRLENVYQCDSCKRVFAATLPNNDVVNMDIAVGTDCKMYMEICSFCAWRVKIALKNVMTDLDVMAKPRVLR